MISLVEGTAVRVFHAVLALVTASLAVRLHCRTWAYEANLATVVRPVRPGAATQVLMLPLVEGAAIPVFRAALVPDTASVKILAVTRPC